MKRHLCPTVLSLLGVLSLVALAGCQLFPIVAKALPKIVPAQYAGLKGKTTAIMVWAEQPVLINYPTIQADITASLQQRLVEAQKTEKPDDLKGTTFPVTWQSILRYQSNNPDADTLPIGDNAKVVGMQRLIYIEVSDFQTRSDLSPDLYKGTINASFKVVELENGQTKVAYEENNITLKYPPKGPDEGALNLGDQRTYVGTINEFANKMAWKFYKHEEERQPGE